MTAFESFEAAIKAAKEEAAKKRAEKRAAKKAADRQAAANRQAAEDAAQASLNCGEGIPDGAIDGSRIIKCSICTADIMPVRQGVGGLWYDGHNAEPVTDGRCCSDCNDSAVIPARIAQIF